MASQRSGGGRSGGGGRSRSSSGRSGGGRSSGSRSSSGRARSEGGRSGGSSSRRAASDGRGDRTRTRQGQAPDGHRDDPGRRGPEGPEPRRPPRGRGRRRGMGSLRGLVSLLIVVIVVLGCYLVVSCANKSDEAEEETSTVTITEASSDDEDTTDADATSDADSSDTDDADTDDADTDDATATTHAASFLERVTELQATYGEATVVEADEDDVPVSHVSGLAVACLVDVQGDGENELLLVYLTDASSEWPYLTYAVEVWGATTDSDEVELLCSGTLVYPYGSPYVQIVDLSGSQIVYWPSYDVETGADLGCYVTPADFGEVELHETNMLVTFTTDTDYTITYSIDGTEVDQETYEAYATTYDIYGSSHDVEYVYLDGSEDTVTLTQETIASLS